MRFIACTALVLMSAAGWSADVYRSTDAQGRVSFSDRPLSRDAKQVAVRTQRPATPAAGAPSAAAPASAASQDAAASEPAVERVRREPTTEERAEDRAKNCAVARERVTKYAESHRLYRDTPNGEREYLSSAEIDEAKARAAADVDTWCD